MKTYLFVAAIILSVIFFGCQSSPSAKDEFRESPLSDSTSFTGLGGDTLMLVKTGAINFKVTDVKQTAADVSALAKEVGGMVFQQKQEFHSIAAKQLHPSKDSILKISAHIPEVTMTVRVPVSALEEFMYEVSAFGYYTENITLDIEDKSIDYLEHMMRQTNRADIVSKPGKSTSKQPSDVQKIYIGDEAIGHNIANRRIAADAAYSAVRLHFFQSPVIMKQMEANTDLDVYTLPASHRLGNAFVSGAVYFLDFLVSIVHLWVFIVIGVLIFFLVKYYRKKVLPKHA